jgi:hypothetical protein
MKEKKVMKADFSKKCFIFNKKPEKLLSLYHRVRSRYYLKSVSYDEIDDLVLKGHSLVGHNHVGASVLKRRYNLNGEIITGLYDIKTKELLGYFILYPLNEKAHQEIISLDIINGKGIEDHHIVDNFEDATCIYIGMVGALNKRVNSGVIIEFIRRIENIAQLGNLESVFTRGATPSGIQMIKNLGFQRIKDPSEISYIKRNS